MGNEKRASAEKDASRSASCSASSPKETVRAPRKKDKRSIRTEEKTKKALLSLLDKRRLSDLTVSDVCRDVGMTRATFYQHYGSLADVLDEILDDFSHELTDIPLEMCEACAEIARFESSPVADDAQAGMPFCHFYASDNPYKVLLDDGVIAERLIERIVDKNLDNMAKALGLSSPEGAEGDERPGGSGEPEGPAGDARRERLRYFNIFRISGCLAAAKAARRNGYSWSLVQPTLDHAIAAAYREWK